MGTYSAKAQNEGGVDPSEETTQHLPQSVSVQAIAQAEQSSEGHIRKLIDDGTLPSYKSGDLVRVLVPDYVAYLDRRKKEQCRKIEARKRSQAAEIATSYNEQQVSASSFTPVEGDTSLPEGQ